MKFIKQSLFSLMVTSAIVPLTSTNLLSSSSSMDSEFTQTHSGSVLLEECIQKYPKLFRDFENVNLEAISKFRQEFAARAQSVDPSLPIEAATMSSNMTSLEPFLEQFQDFLVGFENYANPRTL